MDDGWTSHWLNCTATFCLILNMSVRVYVVSYAFLKSEGHHFDDR